MSRFTITVVDHDQVREPSLGSSGPALNSGNGGTAPALNSGNGGTDPARMCMGPAPDFGRRPALSCGTPRPR